MTPTRGGGYKYQPDPEPPKERPVVVKLEVCDEISPTRWEGETSTGRKIFIRFGFGILTGDYDKRDIGETFYQKQIGGIENSKAEYMSTEEMMAYMADYLDFQLPDW